MKEYEVIKLKREDVIIPEFEFDLVSTDWWELKKNGNPIASAHVAECIEEYYIGDEKVSGKEFDSFLKEEANMVVDWVYDDDWCNYVATVREAV